MSKNTNKIYFLCKLGLQLDETCAAQVPMGAAGFCCQHGLLSQGNDGDSYNRLARIVIPPDVRLDEDIQFRVHAVALISSQVAPFYLMVFCYNTILFERSYLCP